MKKADDLSRQMLSGIIHAEVDSKIDSPLLAEYILLSQNETQIYDRVIQLLTAGVTAVIGIFGGILTFKITDVYVLWGAPSLIALVCGVALVAAAQWSNYYFHLRLVSGKMTQVNPELAGLLYFHRDSVASQFQSLKARGNIKHRYLFFTLFIIVAALFIGLLFYCFTIIFQTSHLSGFLFLTVYISIGGILLLGLSSILSDLPQAQQKAYESMKVGKGNIAAGQILLASNPIKLIFPRTLDFFTKSWLFVSGFIFVLVEKTPSLAAKWAQGSCYNPFIWFVFSSSDSDLPFGYIVFYALLWLIIQEGLIQQAKYIWNDLRDRKRDEGFEGKGNRGVTSGEVSTRAAVVQLFVRWIGGLVIGYVIDIRLFFILFLISLLQVVYELWSKPRGASRPLAIISLALLALGGLFRTLGGALSALPIMTNYLEPRILIFVIAFFFLQVGAIATFWKLEEEHCKELAKESRRPQGDYFHRRGVFWQQFGFGGIFMCAMILFADSLPFVSKYLNYQLLIPRVPVVVSVFVEGMILLLLVSMLVFAIGRPLFSLLFRTRKIIWTKVILILVVAALIGISVAYFNPDTRKLITSVFLLLLSFIVNFTYADITYEQFMFVHFSKNIKVIGQLWFNYFFNAQSGMSLRHLIQVTLMLLNQSQEKVKQTFAKSGLELQNYKFI